MSIFIVKVLVVACLGVPLAVFSLALAVGLMWGVYKTQEEEQR